MNNIKEKIIRRIVKAFGYRLINPTDYSFDKLLKKYSNGKEIIIFDVGANNGQSIERFKKLFTNYNIFAFEPQPNEVQFLVNKYGKDESIKILPYAVGDRSSIIELNVMQKSGTSTLREINTKSDYIIQKSKIHKVTEANQLIKQKVQVRTETLDDFIEKNKIIKVNILKIDTEGYESFVLAGAQQSLSKKIFDLIEVEITIDDRFGSTSNFYDIEKFLIPYGYQVIAFDDLYSRDIRKIFHLNVLYGKRSVIDKWK
jgi:FkbM family methyltransferase